MRNIYIILTSVFNLLTMNTAYCETESPWRVESHELTRCLDGPEAAKKILKTDKEINGLLVPKGSTIVYGAYDNPLCVRVVEDVIYKDATFKKGYYFFNKSGIKNGILAADSYIDGIEYKGSNKIWFNGDGYVVSGVLANNTKINNITYQKGGIQFHGLNKVKVGVLYSDAIIMGKTYKAHTVVNLDPEGNPVEGPDGINIVYLLKLTLFLNLVALLCCCIVLGDFFVKNNKKSYAVSSAAYAMIIILFSSATLLYDFMAGFGGSFVRDSDRFKEIITNSFIFNSVLSLIYYNYFFRLYKSIKNSVDSNYMV